MMRSLFRPENPPAVKIKIYFDRGNDPAYGKAARAGSSLCGKVVCEVVSKDVINGEEMELSIAGRESAMFKGQRSERPICRMAVPLLEFCDRPLQPGVCFVFPFDLKLPETLPSSCSFKMPSNDGVVKVEYKIVVTGFHTSKEREFHVTSSPLPDERVYAFKCPVTIPIKSLNLVEQGTLTLAASVKDTHVGRGDAIQLCLSSRNDSLVDIQRVEVKVQEIVSGDVSPSRKETWDHSFKKTLFVEQIKISGVCHKAKLKRLSRQSNAERERQYAEMFEELELSKYQYIFTCPATAHDSYKGKLLHVQHIIRVKLITNFVSENPSIVIPIKIGNPPSRTTTQVEGQAASSPPRSASNAANILPLALLEPLPPPVPVQSLSEPEPPRSLPARSQSDLAHVNSDNGSIESPRMGVAMMSSSTPSRFSPNAATSMGQSTSELPPDIATSAPNQQFSQSLPVLPPPTAPYAPPGLSSSTSALPNSCPAHVQATAPYMEDMDLPTLIATPVPSDAVDAPVTVVDPRFVVLGGDAVLLQEVPIASNESYAWAQARPTNNPSMPSLSLLFEEMLISVEDYDIVRTKLQDPDWREVFEAVTVSEFGNIIAHVNIDFDQPRVAALLAPVVNRGNFTCEFCAAAVRSTSEWNRATMVERLVPFCTDLQNLSLIQSELNEWDQIITARSMFASIG